MLGTDLEAANAEVGTVERIKEFRGERFRVRQGRCNHRVSSAGEGEGEGEAKREREKRIVGEKLDGSNILSAASRKLDGVDAASSMQIDVVDTSMKIDELADPPLLTLAGFDSRVNVDDLRYR